MSGLNFAGEFSLKEMKLLTSAGGCYRHKKDDTIHRDI